MKSRQDQDQVTAVVTAAVATLASAVKAGVFDGRPALLSLKVMVMKQAMGWRFEKLDADSCQMIVYQYDDDRAVTVIEKAAAGDVVADTLLREVAGEKLQAGLPLPPNLARYVVDKLANRNTGGPSRGKRPGNFFDRDAWVYLAVKNTIERGFRLERNAATGSASASSIVATALSELGVTMSEKSVARIWRDKHPDLSRHDNEIPILISTSASNHFLP
jgi:hypothetical protein